MIKQVIVIRRDLKMRRGKECSQASHASMAFMTKRLQLAPAGKLGDGSEVYEVVLSPVELEWLKGSFTKVCLQVGSERELMDIVIAAVAAGLNVDPITDLGKTEFNGVPTKTCCAIGPDEASKIDAVTGHLKLY